MSDHVELDDYGEETRKVELLRNGEVRYIGDGLKKGDIGFSLTRYPPPERTHSDQYVSIDEIDEVEFEKQWGAAVGSGAEEKRPFLVVDEYGMGAIWAVIYARSSAEIRKQFPALAIPRERPDWMTDELYRHILDIRSCDIDAPLTGWFAAKAKGPGR